MSIRKRLIITSKDQNPDSGNDLLSEKADSGVFSKIFGGASGVSDVRLSLRSLVFGLALLTGLIGFLVFQTFFATAGPQVESLNKPSVSTQSAKNGKTQFFLGIDTSDFDIRVDVLDQTRRLDALLTSIGFTPETVVDLLEEARKKDIETLEKGHEVQIFTAKDGRKERSVLWYKISPDRLAEIKGAPFPQVNIHMLNSYTKVRAAGGIIKTSLWEAVLDRGIHYQMLDRINEALKWSVDLYHLDVGDKFKLVYDENWVENELISVGKLHAVYLETDGKEYFAYLIDNISEPGYYDKVGKPVRRTFLKAPLQYGRISSYFSAERLHPILGDVRSHGGTDYAAPTGTPILAVADGEVLVESENPNNGMFVKIRHDQIYQTQYLHMSRFAEGLQAGARVKQGQVIGYVGQTGLATGPHVCYRFSKNGVEIDPLKENIDQPVILTLEEKDRFYETRDSFAPILRRIVYFKEI